MKAQDIKKILEEEKAASGCRGGQGCRTGRFIAGLDKESHALLTASFRGSEYTNATLIRTLKRLGFTASKDGVRLHRIGECSCEKAGLL